mgnify:CR=1 FL=1
MPARRSAPKPPKTTELHAALAALGFRVADSGPHTSKTLMLQELETLLAAVPADAPAKSYRAAIVEENVLGKGTLSARKETASRLTALHGFDPTKPLFRVLRRLWAMDATARLHVGVLNGLARTSLLMGSREQKARIKVIQRAVPAFRIARSNAGLWTVPLVSMAPRNEVELCMATSTSQGSRC